MRSRWVVTPLVVLKEIILAALLMLVINTMVCGAFVLAIYNVPPSVWDLRGIDRIIFVFIVTMAPIFALARVMEWWISVYRRFSVLFPEQGE